MLGWTVSASAATITVNAGGNLQAAIDAAKPGDTILLQAGATFAGSFKLPAKGGTTYITIRSSTPDSQLPPAGTRITPTYAPLLAKIKSTNAGSAIRTGAGSNYWRLQFLEFAPSSPTSGETMIEFGMADSTQNTLASVPHHLIVDRSYVHGDPGFGARRGIALNSGDAQVIDSWISDIKQVETDTQAICGWNGPGPYLIQNNYIEAGAENIMFGGSDAHIPNMVPSNITIRRNYITKPLKWRNESWTIKNLLEFKNAQNVLVDGNTIENNWAAGQQGYSIVFTPRNQTGATPWAVVKNITIQNNVLRHLAAGFNISGYDDEHSSQQTQHIVIRNNLAYDISPSYGTSSNVASGWFAVIGNGPKDITFDHNTIDNGGNAVIFIYAGVAPTGTKIYQMVINNNLMKHNSYGINGDRVGEGLAAFKAYAPDVTMLRNAMAGGSAKLYPTGNFFPTVATWTADFVGRTAGNYQLVASSLSQNAGTDGKDLGVDFVELNAAMNNSAAPPPPPTTPPPTTAGNTPFSGTPITLPGTIQAENYDKGGDGVGYHDTTSGNSGGAYRSDGVDVTTTSDSGGGYNVKSVRAGEYLRYTVNVSASRTYSIDLRIASSGPGGTVHLSIDGSNVSGSWSLPDTGGWGHWMTVTKTGVALPAGVHTLKLAIDANGPGGTAADINWITVR
ncbi:MAG TPA: carbohydrate-binding protein [Vicinamibacterales bacterium]